MDPGYVARAAPPGSVAYFQLLFTEPAQRPTLTALFALRAAIRQAVTQPLEPAVARLRVEWWRDEIARLERGESRHPVTQALAGAAPALTHAFACLQGLLDAAAAELAGSAFADLDALGDYARASTAPVYRLATLARGIHLRDHSLLDAADALGAGVRLTEILRDVRDDAVAERIYLPLETLEHAQALALIEGQAAPEIETALRDTHALAVSRLDAARRIFRRAPPDPASVIALDWHSAVLEIIARRGFRVVGDRPVPGAVRTVWLAWRAARRAARGLSR